MDRLIKFLIYLISPLLFIQMASAQGANSFTWKGQNGEEVNYKYSCLGEVYQGSQHRKWEFMIDNKDNKVLKCEVVMSNAAGKEVSEALEIEVVGNTSKRIIFLKCNLACDEASEVKLQFNRPVFRKK